MSSEISTPATPTAPLRLAVIVASVRTGRFAPTVSTWFAEQARGYGAFEVDVVDLVEAEHTLPMVFGGTLAPEVQRVRDGLAARLERADAFVVITPEYNHSYPASLKNTIDWFRTEWFTKPVGLVTYGGMAGGQRAAEHLRQVFAELHAVTVRDTLSFAMPRQLFSEEGRPTDEEAANAAAKGLLAQLEWWADALRAARGRTPYPGLG